MKFPARKQGSKQPFYDKFTLVSTYIIKKRQKSNNFKTAVVKMKMAIFFTFRWRSIYLRTLTISNLTHHHPLHPQYCCHHRQIPLGDSHIHHHHRNSCRGPCIAALLCGTESDWFLSTSALHKLYNTLGSGWKRCHYRDPLIIFHCPTIPSWWR